jgi:general secretion pathway protein C
MAPKHSAVAGNARGVALIAVDGKLPKAYQVGSALDGELVLQSVSLRSAAIGPVRGSPTVTLELPPLPAAATGTLPVPAAAFAPAGAAPGVPPRVSAQALSPQIMPVPPGAAPPASPPVLPQSRDQGAPTQ